MTFTDRVEAMIKRMLPVFNGEKKYDVQVALALSLHVTLAMAVGEAESQGLENPPEMGLLLEALQEYLKIAVPAGTCLDDLEFLASIRRAPRSHPS